MLVGVALGVGVLVTVGVGLVVRVGVTVTVGVGVMLVAVGWGPELSGTQEGFPHASMPTIASPLGQGCGAKQSRFTHARVKHCVGPFGPPHEDCHLNWLRS